MSTRILSRFFDAFPKSCCKLNGYLIDKIYGHINHYNSARLPKIAQDRDICITMVFEWMVDHCYEPPKALL